MPKIDVAGVPVNRRAYYPEPLAGAVAGRSQQALGRAAGLTQFGVNLVRLAPGAASGLRHWHEQEDEFVYVVEGEAVLVENEGETVVRPGDAAGFKAGVADGHHFVNRSNTDVLLLVVGTRSPTERAHYPDDDLAYEFDGNGFRFTKKSGEPY
jgi:uncharacterized cupin superfamily protein